MEAILYLRFSFKMKFDINYSWMLIYIIIISIYIPFYDIFLSIKSILAYHSIHNPASFSLPLFPEFPPFLVLSSLFSLMESTYILVYATFQCSCTTHDCIILNVFFQYVILFINVKRNADVLLIACNDIGLAVNTEKTKYIEIKRQDMIANEHTRIGSNSYKKVKIFNI